MLSMSADLTGTDVDLQMINGDEDALAGGVRYAAELVPFSEALARRDEDALSAAREQLAARAGADVLVDTAAVAGNFQRMVRIADATGIPIDEGSIERTAAVRGELQLERFASAADTPLSR